VDQQTIQICISWTNGNAAEIQRVRQELGLFIGVQPLAEALSAKIDEFEKLLRHDEEVEWTPLSRPFFARNKLMPTGSRV